MQEYRVVFFLFESKCTPLSLFLSVFFSLFALLARNVHMYFACRFERRKLVGLKEIFCFFLFVSLSVSLFDGKRVKSKERFKVQEDNLNVFSGRLALIKNAAREKVREKIHSAKIPRML